MLQTYSKFYYGFEVTEDNAYFDFDEGGSELSAEVGVGSYTATSICTALKIALDVAGANTYTVSFDRVTRRITVSSTGLFTIRSLTGSHSGSSICPLLGITESTNHGPITAYTGTLPSGDSYSPQFWLQDYVSPEHHQGAVDATISRTATGRVEVVKYGIEKFMQCTIRFATDLPSNSAIRFNPAGVADLNRFMQFLTTKAPLEFMPDENTPQAFETMILESSPDSSSGTAYQLKEQWDKGLSGYFETGRLKFRVVEEF